MIRPFVYLIAAVSVSVCLVASQQAPQRPDQNRKTDGDKATPQPTINVTVTAPEPDPKIAQDERADRQANLDVQRSIERSTRALAILTVLQFLVGLLASGAALVAANAARKQAKHAEDNIETAKAALDASIAASRADQRAWVGATEISFDQPDGPNSMRAIVNLKNVGKTPALKLTGNILMHGSDRPLNIAEFAKSKDRAQVTTEPSVTTIFPGVSVQLQAHAATVAEERMEKIKSGAITIYVCGEVFYYDAFGGPHTTTFAYVWIPQGRRFDACATYNDAT